jgi:hypothetical protein
VTEAEWLSFTNAREMLPYFWLNRARRTKATRRQLRLFACACARRIFHLLDEQFRDAISLAERLADRLMDSKERETAYQHTWDAMLIRQQSPEPWAGYAARTVANLLREGAFEAAYHACQEEEWAFAWSEEPHSSRGVSELQERAAQSARLAQAILLRHIIGNPFRPCPAPDHLPATVVQLAESLYNGQDCSFALHDALLEAGHADLAEHFRQEQVHPKGCWAVDLLLGNE